MCFYMVQDCSQTTAIGCDRLLGVLAGTAEGSTRGKVCRLSKWRRRTQVVGSNPTSIYLFPYKNTLPTSSGVPVEPVVVLQASVFLYGEVA